jgi:hypothetical protein
VRPDATPLPRPLRPAAPVPRFMRELAAVREVDLAEGLGPARLAALERLAEEAAASARRRRRLLCALLSAAALVAAAVAALALGLH